MTMTARKHQQRGVALIIALLFLGVVTIVSIVAAKNSAVSLQVSGNMRDASDSFQSAEAGIVAALGLAATPYDPFDGKDEEDPFGDLDPNTEHPLRNLNDGVSSVTVDIDLTAAASTCPRSTAADSVGEFSCENYRVSSEHNVANKARTDVNLGVIKELIGTNP